MTESSLTFEFGDESMVKKAILFLLFLLAFTLFLGWKFAAFLVIILFIHEYGHIWAAKRCGVKNGRHVFHSVRGMRRDDEIAFAVAER